MKTTLKTICDSAFITEGTKNLNIVGIFEHINAYKFPATHPRMTFVLSADGKPNEEVSFYFDIRDKKGNVILDKKNEVKTASLSPSGKINLIFNLVNFNIPEAGKYTVNIYVGDLPESLEFEAKIISGGLA